MMKNPKHAAVLGDYGIQYEGPLTPIDVATRRHERIEREKLKNVANRVIINSKNFIIISYQLSL